MQYPQLSIPKSDADLIVLARSGDASAFADIYERHSAAAVSFARFHTRDSFSADDFVSEAFERTFTTLRAGGGPDVSFRAYLYTVIRRIAYENAAKAKRVHLTDDLTPFESATESRDSAVESFENRIVVSAFSGLPERWQAVLWYLEVEGLKPAEVAVMLGLTPNGVSALAYRAREGLRETYLQAHVSTDYRSRRCESLRGKLGAYINGSLAARDTAKLEEHIKTCRECTVVITELRDVGHGLRAVIAPLVLGGVAAASLVAAGQPLSAAAAAAVVIPGPPRILTRLTAGATSVAAVAGVAAIAAFAFSPVDTVDFPSSAAVEEAPPESEPAASAPTATPTSTAAPAPTPLPSASSRSALPRADRSPAVANVPPLLTSIPVPTPAATPILPFTPQPVSNELAVSLVALGELVLGRDGMLSATIEGPARDVTLSFSLPSGVALNESREISVSGGDWSCLQVGSTVRCTSDSTAEVGSIVLPVSVDDSADTVTAPTVVAETPGLPPVLAVAPSPVVRKGLSARFVADGSVASTAVGSSFLSCDPQLSGCDDARNRVGDDPKLLNNNAWPLIALGSDSVSSTTSLSLPSGSEVVFAGLYWSATTAKGDTDALIGQLQLRTPNGSVESISAERVDHVDLAGNDQYQAFADVTSVVAASGSGDWTASGPRIGPHAPVKPGDSISSGAYAGWSLVVVYAEPSIPLGRVTVVDGFQPVTTTAVSFTLSGLEKAELDIGLLAWEGDAGTSGDGLSLDGVALRRDSIYAQEGNSFNSSAAGSGVPNSFGVDVGRFKPATLLNSRTTLTAATTGDHYLVGMLTLTTR